MKCMPFWKGCNRNVDYIDNRHRCLTKVPEDVERYSRTLEELLLDSNQIQELPKSLFRLEQLRKLSLSDNQLSRLTADLASLVNLQELDVSKNDITQVTESIKHCRNLQVLDFSNNPLQELPLSITQLKNLTHLSLNDSSIVRLPHDIGSLINLESLEVRENALQQLPDSIGELFNLKILDVGNNSIDTVPDSISQLMNLQELRMDCNDIAEITSEIGNLKKLMELDLSENKLEKLPQEVGYLCSITDLYLSQNKLEYLPDGIGNLKKLTTLKLDQNKLVQLTSSIGNCISLQELILTENELTELPSSIGRLKNLSILMVDKNKLSNIPPKIGGCIKMGVFSLRDNCIWKLPPELGFLKELHVLDVSGNRLQHLPVSLNSCNLKALWLSENQAQPLLKFQQDVDEETGDKVLTCFLLPQQAFTDSMENLLKDSFGLSPEQDNSRQSWGGQSRSAVKFAEDARQSDSDEETAPTNGKTRQENNFVRHNTPHPKDLRVRHNKMFEKNVDGHMIPHKSGKSKDNGSNYDGSRSPGSQDPCGPQGFSNDIRTSISDGTSGVHELHGRFSVENDIALTDHQNAATASDRVYVAPDVVNHLDGVSGSKREEVSVRGLRQPGVGLGIGIAGGLRSVPYEDEGIFVSEKREEVVVRVLRQPGVGLGISIAGGLGSVPYEDYDEGIFVSKVNPSGAAEKCGVIAGDKIISVNGQSMVNIEHGRAVEILKSTGNDMVVVLSRKKSNSPIHVENHSKLTATTQFNSISSLLQHTANNTPSPSSPPLSSSSAQLLQVQWSHLQPSSSSSFLTNPHSLLSSLSSPQYQLPSSSSSPSQFLPTPVMTPPDQQMQSNKITGGGDSLSDDMIKLQNPEKKLYPKEEIIIIKVNGALGLSIVGGLGHTSLPFGADEPGIFISKITKMGAASLTPLRIGDRILAVNGLDVTNATHQEVVSALISSSDKVTLLVRHDPQPPGLKELILKRRPGETLGLTIMGGEGAHEEGIFISKILPDSPASRNSLLKAGQRILEVNGRTLLGVSQDDAISVFADKSSNVFDILVCNGLDMRSPSSLSSPQSGIPTDSSPLPFYSASLQNGGVNVVKPSLTLKSPTCVTTTTPNKIVVANNCIEKLDAIITEMNRMADGPPPSSWPTKNATKPSLFVPPPSLPPVLKNLLLQPSRSDSVDIKNSSSMSDLLDPPSSLSSPQVENSQSKLSRKASLDTCTRSGQVVSKKNVAEEERRIKAEQRRLARLKFLEGATNRVHDSLIKSHDLGDARPPF